jgi:hypothetical protein
LVFLDAACRVMLVNHGYLAVYVGSYSEKVKWVC